MAEIDALTLYLRRALAVNLEVPGVPALLIKEIDALKAHLKGAQAAAPPRDLQDEAVRRFRTSGQLDGPTTARAVCFGASSRLSGTESPLIELAILGHLLDSVDRYIENPRIYRRFYRGLLHSYFAYDYAKAPTNGRKNWDRLREYLAERCSNIRCDGVTPDWVDTLLRNQNLLSTNATKKYGPELLRERTTEVDQVRIHLAINQSSWFIRELILSRIEAATYEQHDAFRALVSDLLAALSPYPLIEDEGLRLILDRYARIRGVGEDSDLRDRAVKKWGSPWLDSRQVYWSRVHIDARKMVEQWLKKDLIRGFFEVLSEDSKTDKRRVEFWLRYHDLIEDMHFALGPRALASRSVDMVSLREKMADHKLTLMSGGGAGNNAFIMRMGNYLVVEFGLKGNACFIFSAESPPFSLRGSVAGDSSGLKYDTGDNRLLHKDSLDTPWERKFSHRLSQCGLNPSPSESALPAQATYPDPVFAGIARSNRTLLLAFLNENALLWDDKTSKGGNFSVKHHLKTGFVADGLRRYGLSYSDRGFWYRRGLPK